MTNRNIAMAAVTFALGALACDPALAHHAMDGALPATFAQGLISGLAHPVIGIDHQAFVIAVGVAAALAGLKWWLPTLFVVASALGVGIHVIEFDLPAAEPVIALSVLAAGGLLVSGRAVPVPAWAALFAVAGLFHGFAYGEAIVGAEATPLLAYLAGLVVVQSAIAVAVMLLVRRRGALAAAAVEPRLAGAFALGVGLSAFVGQIAG